MVDNIEGCFGADLATKRLSSMGVCRGEERGGCHGIVIHYKTFF